MKWRTRRVGNSLPKASGKNTDWFLNLRTDRSSALGWKTGRFLFRLSGEAEPGSSTLWKGEKSSFTFVWTAMSQQRSVPVDSTLNYRIIMRKCSTTGTISRDYMHRDS